MLGTDAADLLNLRLGHRLLVGNNGERLHNNIGQLGFLRLFCQNDQISVILLLGTELIGRIQFQQPDSRLRPIVFSLQTIQYLLCLRGRKANGGCQAVQLHGIPHGKQDGFYGSLFIPGRIPHRRRLRSVRRRGIRNLFYSLFRRLCFRSLQLFFTDVLQFAFLPVCSRFCSVLSVYGEVEV